MIRMHLNRSCQVATALLLAAGIAGCAHQRPMDSAVAASAASAGEPRPGLIADMGDFWL